MKRTISITVCFSLIFSLFATFALPVSAGSLPFTDVSESSEYYEAIEYVYNEGIMHGTTTTTFRPDNTLTRGMAMALLYRISGSTLEVAPSFSDVPADSYYYYPIGWAEQEGIAAGTTATTFRPEQAVTRQQFICFLYRYASDYESYSYTIPDSDIYTLLTDDSSVASYAVTPVNWAMNCGILNAHVSYAFGPTTNVTRGLCADYLHRFMTLALGNGRVLVQSSLENGLAEDIGYFMGEMGYDAHIKSGMQAPAIEFALYNSANVHILAHGNNTSIVLDNLELGYPELTYSAIDYGAMADVDLAFIAACKAGGTFCSTLRNTGRASIVVGFTEDIASTTNTNGIHKFSQQFYYYYNEGYTAYDAAVKALEIVYQLYGISFGCDSCVVYD